MMTTQMKAPPVFDEQDDYSSWRMFTEFSFCAQQTCIKVIEISSHNMWWSQIEGYERYDNSNIWWIELKGHDGTLPIKKEECLYGRYREGYEKKPKVFWNK